MVRERFERVGAEKVIRACHQDLLGTHTPWGGDLNPQLCRMDRRPARSGKTLRVACWTGGRPKSNILDWRTDK